MLLNALANQKLNNVQISEIIVIASGCTDRTFQIVEHLQHEWKNGRFPELHLIVQTERSGKSSAVNLFIQEAKEDVLVLESADTIPAPQTIENLCAPFIDHTVGLAGAHPVPTNNPNRFIGFCVHNMWQMHHEIALKSPKCGELIAFRKNLHSILPGNPTQIITGIPANSAVDEASIEAAIRDHNLKTIYVPEAIVYNKGPETVREFIAQRRRISAGHFWLRKHFAHKPSTASKRTALFLTLSRFGLNPVHPLLSLKNDCWLIGMMALEAWAKILGRYDYYIKKRDHMVWDRIGTSKNPLV